MVDSPVSDDWIKRNFYDQPRESYTPLTFGELKVGDRFISLPLPGDNNGHGGFRTTHYSFVKTDYRERTSHVDLVKNARRQSGNGSSSFPLSFLVIKIE